MRSQQDGSFCNNVIPNSFNHVFRSIPTIGFGGEFANLLLAE